MITYKNFIIISLLSSSFLCIGMKNNDRSLIPYGNLFREENFVDFTEEPYKNIEKKFRDKWGYSIPDTLIYCKNKSTYKVVSVTDSNKAQIIDTFNPVLTVNVKKAHTFFTQKELLEKTIARPEVFNKKIANYNVQLQKERASENKSHSKTNKQSIIAKQKQIIAKPTINAQQKKAALKKKNAFPLAEQKNKIYSLESQQKMNILRYLMKKYTVQTPAQLKNKFYERCILKGCHGLNGRVNAQCTWSYCRYENDLFIDTHDIKSDNESDDASSDSWYDSSSSD